METGTEAASTTTPTGAPAPAFNTEPAAVFWLVWAGVWTATVLCGMAFLFVNRHMPFLRIRGLALSFGAVAMLHLYWVSVQIGLSVGQFVPDGAEFWVMGLYLPFGIALFHASNSRFLHVAKAQRRYADKTPPPCSAACLPPSPSSSPSSSPSPSPSPSKPPPSPAAACSRGLRDRRSLAARFRRLDYTTKMLTVVCTGMVVQVLLTVAMYLASRKYHPWFGIPGTEAKGTPTQQKVEMGRGWEWWPSVLWQFVWAWMVAPVILWKSRGIRDTQGWRVQTIACCLASLHATPMWLVALYVPEMAPVNRYFIPPQWICLSILFIEIFAIFIPCWQVVGHKSLQQETLESIAVWEAKSKNRNNNNDDEDDDGGGGHGSDSSFITGSTKVGSRTSSVVWQSLVELEKNTSQADSVYTMSALEYVLEKNPEPLRKFSALRDFSGENIAFLSAVGEWKASIPQGPGAGRQRSPELARDRFNRALRIYTEFVSPYHAEFQINIASQDLKRLQGVFDHAARIMDGGRTERFTDPVVPFEDAMWNPAAAAAAAGQEGSGQEDSGSAYPSADRVQYWGEIPEAFNAAVFDDAEASIKYLVLTNTWPKFVKERRSSLGSEDSGETAETDHSASTSTSTSALSRVA
ncbi:hypothetical protein CSHISOI_08023, partial [Colletotrichum shisoi]